jgi:hypothetical protein
MPDFAPTATPRVVYHYTSAGLAHSITFRGFRDESQATSEARATSAIQAIATNLDFLLCEDLVVTQAFYIPQDSEVSVLASIPTIDAGDVAIEDFSIQDKISSLGFAGKSNAPTGSRANFKIFGVSTNPDVTPAVATSNFLITGLENADIAALVTALNGFNLPAIDNGQVRWYNRATLKVNDKWLKDARRGIVS